MSELHVAELKRALSLINPAVSNKDFIPIFSHYCFSGDKITAFNDPLGIEIEFDSGLTGGLKGNTFWAWVNALPESSNIKYTPSLNLLRANCGRAKIEIALRDQNEFIHEKPALDGLAVPVTAEFIAALDACLLSVNAASDVPSMAGVTISRGYDCLLFHSTNGIAISESIVPDNGDGFINGSVVVPAKFCSVLKKLFSEMPSHVVTAYFTPASVLVTFDGDVKLSMWSKILDTTKAAPLDFEGEMDKALQGFDMSSSFTVTEQIMSTMKRLLSVYSTSTVESRMVKATTSGKELTLEIEKASLKMNEVLELDAPQPHVNAVIDLEKLVNALRVGNGMAMLPNLVVVTSEQLTYLQAHQNGK